MTIKENVEHKVAWEEILNSPDFKGHQSVIWDYRNLDRLETYWMSDVHLGHKQCDEDLFKRHVDMIGESNMPFADLGDLIENATRNSVGAGVYEQEAIADAQVEAAIAHYEPVSRLLQTMQIGNHELRSWNSGGLNPTRTMAKRLNAKYGSPGMFHVIKVGNQTYTVYSTHGGSGATTTGGKFNSLKRMGDIFPSADVVIQGHSHDTIYHSRELMNCNGRGEIKKHKQHMVMNGAYLNWWDSYGQIKGYAPTNKGSAKINFHGDRRLIEVSFT